MHPQEQQELERLSRLDKFAPHILHPPLLDRKGEGLISRPHCLYVGANSFRAEGLTTLAQSYTVSLVEPHLPNVNHYRNDPRITGIIFHDTIENYILTTSAYYDLIFWWHGPEHVSRETFYSILPHLESKSNTLVLAMPWGKYEQGEWQGNPYESHLWSIDLADIPYSYCVTHVGRPNERGSCLIAWKEKRCTI